MAYLTKHLRLIGKVILVILSGPVVVIVALMVGQLYALMVLLALPFILAFEVIDRKIHGATPASKELDELQKRYPDVPRQMLRKTERDSLKKEAAQDIDLSTRADS
jgi:hypothetical protein